jgi:hypothetical protein
LPLSLVSVALFDNVYRSRKSHFSSNHQYNYHQPGQLYAQHPQTWSTTEVVGWLQLKNVSEQIVAAFQTEGITGDLLLHVSKDDMATMGISMLIEEGF